MNQIAQNVSSVYCKFFSDLFYYFLGQNKFNGQDIYKSNRKGDNIV